MIGSSTTQYHLQVQKLPISKTFRDPPEQRGYIGEGGPALLVCGSAQAHYVMTTLLNQHAYDALKAVADEVAADLHRLLLPRHQLRPAHNTPPVSSGFRGIRLLIPQDFGVGFRGINTGLRPNNIRRLLARRQLRVAHNTPPAGFGMSRVVRGSDAGSENPTLLQGGSYALPYPGCHISGCSSISLKVMLNPHRWSWACLSIPAFTCPYVLQVNLMPFESNRSQGSERACTG
jgi:hypothetical protein